MREAATTTSVGMEEELAEWNGARGEVTARVLRLLTGPIFPMEAITSTTDPSIKNLRVATMGTVAVVEERAETGKGSGIEREIAATGTGAIEGIEATAGGIGAENDTQAALRTNPMAVDGMEERIDGTAEVMAEKIGGMAMIDGATTEVQEGEE